MKVCYVTLAQFSTSNGRYGRFHDLIQHLNGHSNQPFDHEIIPFLTDSGDEEPKLLGSLDEIWATPKINIPLLANIPDIKQKLEEKTFDVLHVFKYHPIIGLTLALSNVSTPVVLGPNLGGWYPNRSDLVWDHTLSEFAFNRFDFYQRYAGVQLLQPDHLMSFSKYHAEMIQQLGIEEAKVSVLRPGMRRSFSPNTLRSSSNSNEMEFIYVGDLSDHKGYPILVKALEHVDHNVNLRIVGAGRNGEIGRNISSRHSVIFEGFVEREELPDYYAKADAFLIPSVDEMGPNTILEAIASGLPIIASDSDSVAEYARLGSSVLFTPRDPFALADAMEKCRTHLSNLNRVAMDRSEELSLDDTCNQLSQIYEGLV